MRPLAYHITWTTYGTWLSGDGRGWVDGTERGVQPPDPAKEAAMKARMAEPPVTLSPDQRCLVESVIRDHVRVRRWTLHALNVRTNHIHVVVTADRDPETVMEQFKAWASRRLSEASGGRRKWWTEHGSTKWINDEAYLASAIHYVSELQ